MRAPLVVAMGLVVIVGCRKAGPAPEEPRAVRTTVVAQVSGDELLTQTGEIQPRRETDLSFALDGRLRSRTVEIGARVEKGQVLALLDDGLVQNELRAARADLTSASSALELAQTNVDRQQKLLAGNVASPQQMDEANAALRSAQARRDVAAAAVLNAQTKLGYATLRAAEPGVVTAVGANIGQVIAPGQMVVRVATLERDAVFSVAERIVSTAPADARVEVRLVAAPSVSVLGTVREASPAADPVTHTYRVRIGLVDPPASMAFGAAVVGRVALPGGQVVALPMAALTGAPEAPAVFVVDPASKTLRLCPVRVARFGTDQVFLAGGLRDGDRVVTAGVSKLRPDQRVALADFDGGAP